MKSYEVVINMVRGYIITFYPLSLGINELGLRNLAESSMLKEPDPNGEIRYYHNLYKLLVPGQTLVLDYDGKDVQFLEIKELVNYE